MTILTAMSAAQTNDDRWKVSLYAGLATAVVALVMVLLKSVPVLAALVGVVVGAAPLLGYDFARGVLGANWRPVIAGLIGNILFIVGFVILQVVGFVEPGAAYGWTIPALMILSIILWPIVVGAMSPNQSVGKLLVASLLGLILGLIVVLAVILPLFGQNPSSWPGIAAILFLSVWGGTVGAALSAWGK